MQAGEAVVVRNFIAVRWVLIYTMVLNLLVTGVKLVVGYLTGSLSLIADGFDSLFDSASNVVGLVGIYVARRPPDPSHPYGHRKFETLSAASITILLFLTTIELVRGAINRLRNPVAPEVTVWTFVALGLSVAVHLYVTWYERRRGRELKSQFLLADAAHTQADVLVSISVAAGLVLVRAGLPSIDAILALGIAVLIAKIGIEIIRDTSKVLADAAALDVAEVERIAREVPGVETLHHVRSRGQEDDIHLDLHIRVREDMPVAQAHEIAHEVERRLLSEVDGLRDVIVHVEPERGAGPREHLLDRRIRAIARRLPGTAVHSIQAHEVEGRFFVTLHLEVDRTLTVEEAHGLASQLEDMLREELPATASVEVHVEPGDRGGAQAAVADEAAYQTVRVAIDEATRSVPGLSGCHDLVVQHIHGELHVSAHWECDGTLRVDEAHSLTRELERRIQETLPEVGRVVVHVEPRPPQ
ncbi:MAG: cation-efflux pump [Anaerolineae bacterium]|nr:cation-efflux pump [Anaerolineae bacterium]